MAVGFNADGESYTRSLSLGSVASWSVACWVKLAADRAATTVIWQIDNGSGSSRFRANAWNGTALTFQTDSGGWFGTTGHTLAVGTWTFIGMSGTANPGQVRFAIRAAGSNSWTTNTIGQTNVTFNASTLRLGDGAVANEWLNGALAGVKVWNTAMSVAELQQEADSYLPKRTSDLVAWYPLVTNNGDYSGAGLTLSGGAGAVLEDGPPLGWSVGRRRIILPASSATPKSLADAASAADALAVSAAAALTESGTAADALSVAASPSLADAGSAAEGLAVSASVPLAESATGADLLSTGVPKSVADAGSAADVLSASAAVPLAETGAAADALSVTAATALADAGSGADTVLAGELLAKSIADAGSADDDLSVIVTRDFGRAKPPYVRWSAGAPVVEASAGAPQVGWSASEPESSWVARPPYVRWSAGAPVAEEVS